jgi:5-methylcytosine-specific restriction endonuclease McrA
MSRVLVLNLDYEPLNICNAQRALKMILNGKADVLHSYDSVLMSGGGDIFEIPSVVRLRHNVKKRYVRTFRVSRHGIFSRDNFTCQYCGKKNVDLTLDHIYPRHLGGSHTWDNLVACCKKCNALKGWKTLEQSGMALLSTPKVPKYHFASLLTSSEDTHDNVWQYYIQL